MRRAKYECSIFVVIVQVRNNDFTLETLVNAFQRRKDLVNREMWVSRSLTFVLRSNLMKRQELYHCSRCSLN